MDSINHQQAEENYKDLKGNDAGKKIKEMAEKADSCFFCTKITTGHPLHTRPMSPQKIDEDGNFWFFSADDSYKNADLQLDNKVHLLFQGSAHSDFLSVYGQATISRDKALIEELWSPLLKTWFTQGVNDTRITIIKIETLEAYYWDNKHGDAIAFIKMAAGALLGKTIDDSIEGKLKI